MAGKIDKSQPYAWDKALAGRYDELEERANAPYDGAVGGLPDWVPQHFQIEFEETRNILFNSLSHAEILGYLQRFDKFLDPNYDGRELFPAQFIQRIGRLRCYQKAIALGKIDGLRFLAGDNAAKGAKFPAGEVLGEPAYAKLNQFQIGQDILRTLDNWEQKGVFVK